MDQEPLAEASISQEYISIHSEEDQAHLKSKDREMSDIPAKTKPEKKSALKKFTRDRPPLTGMDFSEQKKSNFAFFIWRKFNLNSK